jgi:hypothetical protein
MLARSTALAALAAVLVSTAAGVLLPIPSALAAAEEFTTELRQAGGNLAPGATITVQVEVRWDGRPERYAPAAPDLQLPPGSTQALGRTGSEFNGQQTRWWSNVTVILPDSPAPWKVGPATVLVRTRGGVEKITTAPLELGRRNGLRALIGQGIGSGVVVLLLVGWLLFRLRALDAEEAQTPVDFSVARLHLSYANGATPEQAWELLIKALLALPAESVDNANLPRLEDLQERLERSRFGGESITDLECRELRKALEQQMET